MHIYFSGIGGAGTGPLAQIALEAGHRVSGSDIQPSAYIDYLKKHGISDIHIGQNEAAIRSAHEKDPIDWLVYSSALTMAGPNHPELNYAEQQNIKVSKRDALINQILKERGLKLIAIAGTHGKTTTTAMVTWLFRAARQPISYLLPAKTSFAEMGKLDPNSKYFVLEADEFDRQFLSFEPFISLISGVSWDHHEIYPTREDYIDAFREFIDQSAHTYLWQEDADYLGLTSSSQITVLDPIGPLISGLSLTGQYNRLDAQLAMAAYSKATGTPQKDLVDLINQFPGLSRRMEPIVPGLYSDYAHTPEKIRGAMSVASEMAAKSGQAIVVLYEPLTNRRQHYIKQLYGGVFKGASHIYWLPSYLAREDPKDRIIPPEELISYLDDPGIAEPALKNDHLKQAINDHLAKGDMVVAMAGGGGGSLDDWLREQFRP